MCKTIALSFSIQYDRFDFSPEICFAVKCIRHCLPFVTVRNLFSPLKSYSPRSVPQLSITRKEQFSWTRQIILLAMSCRWSLGRLKQLCPRLIAVPYHCRLHLPALPFQTSLKTNKNSTENNLGAIKTSMTSLNVLRRMTFDFLEQCNLRTTWT